MTEGTAGQVVYTIPDTTAGVGVSYSSICIAPTIVLCSCGKSFTCEPEWKFCPYCGIKFQDC